jgi:hypothetical protein
MLIVIDESGEPYFKEGSSKFFVLGLIIFRSFEAAENASKHISNARNEAKLLKREFKFSSSKDFAKDIFFNKLSKCDFESKVIVIEKNKIRDNELKYNPRKFYNFALKVLLKNIEFEKSVIKIDGRGDRGFRKVILSFIRTEIPERKIKDVKFIDSEKDNLVQMADMITGCIARTYNSQNKSNPWRKLLNKKVEEIKLS